MLFSAFSQPEWISECHAMAMYIMKRKAERKKNERDLVCCSAEILYTVFDWQCFVFHFNSFWIIDVLLILYVHRNSSFVGLIEQLGWQILVFYYLFSSFYVFVNWINSFLCQDKPKFAFLHPSNFRRTWTQWLPKKYWAAVRKMFWAMNRWMCATSKNPRVTIKWSPLGGKWKLILGI